MSKATDPTRTKKKSGVSVTKRRKASKPSEELSREHFELLISDEYELTRPIPVSVLRYSDDSAMIASAELNLYAEGDNEFEARRLFSEILVEQLEDLEAEGVQKLGKLLRIQLSMLKRLLKKIPRPRKRRPNRS